MCIVFERRRSRTLCKFLLEWSKNFIIYRGMITDSMRYTTPWKLANLREINGFEIVQEPSMNQAMDQEPFPALLSINGNPTNQHVSMHCLGVILWWYSIAEYLLYAQNGCVAFRWIWERDRAWEIWSRLCSKTCSGLCFLWHWRLFCCLARLVFC